jgi:hypothetical protein
MAHSGRRSTCLDSSGFHVGKKAVAARFDDNSARPAPAAGSRKLNENTKKIRLNARPPERPRPDQSSR